MTTMTTPAMTTPATTELPRYIRGERIPDGVTFLSENGNVCLKLAKVTFDQVLAFGSAQGIAEIPQYDDAKLLRALAWVAARFADKGADGKIYLILPVSKEKQRVSLGMYLRHLHAFRRALQQEQYRRRTQDAF